MELLTFCMKPSRLRRRSSAASVRYQRVPCLVFECEMRCGRARTFVEGIVGIAVAIINLQIGSGRENATYGSRKRYCNPTMTDERFSTYRRISVPALRLRDEPAYGLPVFPQYVSGHVSHSARGSVVSGAALTGRRSLPDPSSGDISANSRFSTDAPSERPPRESQGEGQDADLLDTPHFRRLVRIVGVDRERELELSSLIDT